MLVNFTLKNFRSFRDEKVFDLQSSSIKEHKDSIINKGKYKLLPLSIFYGANSSGKSNLLKAITIMRSIIVNSKQLNQWSALPYEPFAFDNTSTNQPTLFEIQFIQEESLYRYGFEYNKQEIISEWLYEKRFSEKEYELFVRVGDTIKLSEKRFQEGIGKEEATEKNRLFLSVVAQLKGKKSQSILNWFYGCRFLSGIDNNAYEEYSFEHFLNKTQEAKQAQDFFNTLQLGFNNFFVKKEKISNEMFNLFPDFVKIQLGTDENSTTLLNSYTIHNIYDEYGKIIEQKEFAKNKIESEGTKKIIEISIPIFDTLNRGAVLVVDELDAKLHPLLTRNIVLLFMNPNINKNGAQLIFATHDTNLLDLNIIRRDQIWFTEKDNTESTDIYSLIEFKDEEGNKIRNDRDIKKDYIRGRYGAIPFIGV